VASLPLAFFFRHKTEEMIFMAQFAINIPDDHVGRVVEAMCGVYGYSDYIDNPDFNSNAPESEVNPRLITNPEGRGQFANRKVREFLIENVRAHETRIAADAAREGVQIDFAISDPS
jgi:hypothetical protein